MLSLYVVVDGVEALLVFVVAAILADIIGQNLDGPFGQVLSHIDRHIDADGDIGQRIADDRNPGLAPLEGEPKEEEEQVDDEENGEGHPEAGEQGVVGRVEPVGEARAQHQDDGDDICPCHQIDGECLQLLDHCLLASKSFCFSSFDRLS